MAMSGSRTSRVDVDAIAAELLAAYRTHQPVAPLASRYESLSVDDAYAIQRRQIALRTEAGARIVGFKIGLTSAAMRRQLGIDQPDYGHLLTDMVHDGDIAISVEGFLQPKAEPEVALVLSHPLRGPGLSVQDVVDATAYAVPAIEIIDSRIVDWKIALVDTIADNASSGGVVLGSTRTSLSATELPLVRCVLRRNGQIEHTGVGAAVMGSPLDAATWLANVLTARGAELEAGHVILTGAITAAIPVRAGDRVIAELDGLGTVAAEFE
jgi:2-keto-4-pentenoate hydratase